MKWVKTKKLHVAYARRYFKKGRILDIGCGKYPLGGAITVDIDPAVSSDLKASSTHLPFANDVFDGINCSHMLEHLRTQDAVLDTLKEFKRVLKLGGKLLLIVPQNIGYDPKHYFCFTKPLLTDYLRITGFRKVKCGHRVWLPFVWRFPMRWKGDFVCEGVA